MKRFKRIYLELTNQCNLSCSFCPSAERPITSIKLSDLQNIIPQLARQTDEIRPHVLGEPLTYRYFDTFLSLCNENSLTVKITTNGTLLHPSNSQLLSHKCIREINFSIQSFQAGSSLTENKYLQSILNFCDNQAIRDAQIHINFRFWNLQNGKLPESHKGILSEIFSHYKIYPNTPADSRGSIKLAHMRRLQFDNEFIWPSMHVPFCGDNGTCRGTITHIGILSNGSVIPCCLDAFGTIEIGNILKNPLSEIIENNRLQNMTDGFKRDFCVEELCKRCTYRERFSCHTEHKTQNTDTFGIKNKL